MQVVRGAITLRMVLNKFLQCGVREGVSLGGGYPILVRPDKVSVIRRRHVVKKGGSLGGEGYRKLVRADKVSVIWKLLQ